MVHSNQSLFTEQKWYLVSPAANGQWSDVVAGWAAAGATAASSATFYKFIYKLHEPVTNGVSLSQNSWDQIDITGTHDDLEENVGYFVYVETAGTESEPAAAALLQIVVSSEMGNGPGGLLSNASRYNAGGDPSHTGADTDTHGPNYGISIVTADDSTFDSLKLKSVQVVIDGAHYTSYDWNTTDMNEGFGDFDTLEGWAVARSGALNEVNGNPAATSVSNTTTSGGTIVSGRNRDMEVLRITPNHKVPPTDGYEDTAPQLLATSSVQVVFYDSANSTDVTFRADSVGAGEYKLDVVNV